MPRSRKSTTGGALPTKDEILSYVTANPGAGKRDIARAFHIKGNDRIALKKILRELSGEGLIEGRKKRMTQTGRPALRDRRRSNGARRRRRADGRTGRVGF